MGLAECELNRKNIICKMNDLDETKWSEIPRNKSNERNNVTEIEQWARIIFATGLT